MLREIKPDGIALEATYEDHFPLSRLKNLVLQYHSADVIYCLRNTHVSCFGFEDINLMRMHTSYIKEACNGLSINCTHECLDNLETLNDALSFNRTLFGFKKVLQFSEKLSLLNVAMIIGKNHLKDFEKIQYPKLQLHDLST